MRNKPSALFLNLCVYLCLAFLLLSCAQVVSPTGGLKDVLPPKVEKTIPENPSTNFQGNKIQIFFNEYITLKDLNSQIIISPPLKKMPEVKIKNKVLSVDLEDTLKPNATYTFNFGNAIVDFTEGNPVENFQFVFSTGNFLDSLQVSGHVDKAFNHGIEKGVLVMLYAIEKTQKDSFPYFELPDYFGKTNEAGNYSISNVKEGKYKIFALKDGNSNYKFDSDEELVAFQDSALNLNQNTKVNLELFQEQKAKLYLKKPVRNAFGNLTFAFSKPTQNISFEHLLAGEKFRWSTVEQSTNKDTVILWFNGPSGDSIKIKVLEAGKVLDTVSLRVLTRENIGGRGDVVKSIRIKSNVNGDASFDLNKILKLLFQQPISSMQSTKLKLTKGKVEIPFTLDWIDSLKKATKIDAILEEDSTYKLLILPGFVFDYEGLTNDTMQFVFHVLAERDYGTLKLKVKLAQEANYILQLLDEKENVIRERKLSKSEIVYYDYMKPANYKFKLILDANNNGKWDTGKFLENKQAEKTFYYPTTLTVRANWDMEELWDLSK